MDVEAYGPTALRWLFLDFNSYFASVEQQEYPALRGRPVVVAPAESEATSAIAASAEAKRFGVRTGTRIYEARRLCPGLVVRPADHALYVRYHHRLKAEIERHIPITQVCSVDEVACALMGGERVEARALTLARDIKAGIRANVGEMLRSSIGLAPSKLLAKTASDMEKPDGLTVLAPGSLPGRLLDLRLGDISGIGSNMERRLQAAGIHTLAALWDLPAKQMRQIWGGVTGERFWYALHGYDLPEAAAGPMRSISHGHVMAPAQRGAADARAMARHLMVRAAGRLRSHGLEAGALGLWLRTEQGEALGQGLRLPRTGNSLLLLRGLDELWARVEGELSGRRIKKLDVTLSDFASAGTTPRDLFDWATQQNAPKKDGALFAAIDRLNAQFGKDTVRLGAVPDAHQAVVGTKIAFAHIPEIEG
ncbi:Y-family DNA polymerase [Govanella unica]|uniref:DNA-directed DNA polymerase n=1 Tax=Govanella unica TaxID=2975056 RepID=A0A9X3Z786_9PROT|nr:hypothetical protein [Govania unica]MDA5193906.1 hypothetical protein [Govania unica]